MEGLSELAAAVETGRSDVSVRLVSELLAAGTGALLILDEGLVAGMERVGRLFEDGEVFLPDVLMAAQAMKASMAILRPVLASRGGADRGTVVIGTVQGDQHDIGKNLVAIMLEGAGYTVVDLGCDVPDERFVAAARDHGARLVAMSALLNTTMGRMKAVVGRIRADAALSGTRILVGGAPLDEAFARAIGADGWAPDAVAATRVAAALLNG